MAIVDDRNKPLRDDVRLLGDLLGATLRTQAGIEVFERVERVRALAKRARDGHAGEFETLAAELSQMPVDEALPVARAFSHFLSLANIAEQHHRIRRRRAYQQDAGTPPQRGSCEDAFQRLVASGVSPDQLHSAVCALRIELILTAHPTQAARRTLVQKYHRIADALAKGDRPDLTQPERDEVRNALLREITAAWGTADVRHERPTPIDEVHGGLIIFENSLWHALPRYVRSVDRALRAATGRGLPPEVTPVRFGSWIGGDRDGNPHVTPEVTRRACLLSRLDAATLYLEDIGALRDELSLDVAAPNLGNGTSPEPYRDLLDTVHARLETTRAWAERAIDDEGVDVPAGAYIDPSEFADALRRCERSLRDTGYGILADGRLSDTLRRITAFGMTLAPLDIRQDAARHTDAMTALTETLGLGSYAAWNEETRVEFLLGELSRGGFRIPATLEATAPVLDVLDTFRMIARIPRGSLGAYVITMAANPSDVLAVELLQTGAGVRSPLRVVPLFETSRDLANAGVVLTRLLSLPWYLSRIDGRQEVMIGYSDSAKEIGRFSAGWALYRAQEDIVRTCRRHGVRVTLFHGRGGTVARGGGPTYLALQSQPPGSVDGTLRVTEQGEMLETLFGLPTLAVRTMEVYTSGLLEAWLTPAQAVTPAWRDCMDRLDADARAAYRGVVYEDPRFPEYFRAATPEEEIGELNIGSRPARRRSGSNLVGLRAIPWQFAWTQTRLLLGAWLGVEDALERAQARGDEETVRAMYDGWPFFRSSIDLIEMVLAKADARIAAEYDRRLVGHDLQGVGAALRGRLERAIRAVLDVTGHGVLLETTPVLRRSIDVRNPYVDPINLVQVELLRRHREHPDPRVHAALLVTINGVAAGMRNTG